MPLPSVGVVPVNPAGVEPLQIICAELTVLFVITGFTVICIALEVLEQPPDETVLLYQVV